MDEHIKNCQDIKPSIWSKIFRRKKKSLDEKVEDKKENERKENEKKKKKDKKLAESQE